MGLFIYRKLFKNSWDIFLKNVHKISGLFFEFFSQENHGIFVLWKRNYFAVLIDVPLVGSEKSGEMKKKRVYINLLIHPIKKWCLIKTKKWQATKKDETYLEWS